jgi:hypothetical protein
MAVRAKFKVDSKEEILYAMEADRAQKMVTIKLSPVNCKHKKNEKTGQWDIIESENTTFWRASPCGELRLGCINMDAAQQFELGQEYFVDFTPVEAKDQCS